VVGVWRSLQCPPNSCRNPVIPAESSGMKFGRKACYFFHSGVLFFWRNDRIPELRPECSAEFTGTECDGIQLFVWHILFVYFTPVAKQTRHCSLPPPTILFAAPSIHHHPPSMARTTVTTTTTMTMRHRPTMATTKNDAMRRCQVRRGNETTTNNDDKCRCLPYWAISCSVLRSGSVRFFAPKTRNRGPQLVQDRPRYWGDRTGPPRTGLSLSTQPKKTSSDRFFDVIFVVPIEIIFISTIITLKIKQNI
jgi:hypothetical protein